MLWMLTLESKEVDKSVAPARQWRWRGKASVVAGLLVELVVQLPTQGLAASDREQPSAATAGASASGYGEVRRVWVLTTDTRSASEIESGALRADEIPIQYELKCEAGHLQSAQRSYSGTGYGQDRTWTVTVNGDLLSRGGSSVLNYALESVCGV